jgi:two-component system chemotaxis sensor kinase CheA
MLDRMRKGELHVDADLMQLLLDSVDHLAELIDAGRDLAVAPDSGPMMERLELAIDAGAAGEQEELSEDEFRAQIAELLAANDLSGTSSEEEPVASAADDVEAAKFFADTEAVPTPSLTTNAASKNAPVAEAKPVPRNALSRKNDTARGGESQMLRVAPDKVDRLINLVGELVIHQAMIHDILDRQESTVSAELLEAMMGMQQATSELQERVMSVRMLPIRQAFGRFPRLVHDLAGVTGKKIDLKTSGEETELDKTLIEGIIDPLTHIVRNSIDHGLETPDDRIAAGKSEVGLVSLRAFHEGGTIVVEVTDDGRGLDRDRILRKAIQSGIVSEADSLTDDQIYNLIYRPGFSTAQVVTDVSGRGVGLDIVVQGVRALGGSVSVTSRAGLGATFRIRLPLTMAIMEGLSLSVGEEIYILPLTSIVESIRARREDIHQLKGSQEIVILRAETLPVLRLSRLFAITSSVTSLEEGLLVIVENGGHKVALHVDDLIGQKQVVVKSLETNYTKIEGVAGATIMGDGRVALILDVASLVALSGATSLLHAA